MKKDIKDYLHLYLGCELSINGNIYRLRSVDLTKKWIAFNADGYYGNPIKTNLGTNVKPILRKLSSMTEEERNELRSLQPAGEDMFWLKNLGMPAHFLLSRGFDLFGLIEEGLAIEKTTVGGEQ